MKIIIIIKITHHFANQGDRLLLPKVRHAINAQYSSFPEDNNMDIPVMEHECLVRTAKQRHGSNSESE